MKYFLLIYFILFFENTYGSSLDSLKIELSKCKLDTNKVKIYHHLASQYYKKGKIDSSLKYSKIGLQTAMQINWQYGVAENYEIMGIAYIGNGQYYLATEVYFKALPIREKLNNKYKLGIVYRKIGDCYSVLMETQKALSI